MAQELVYLSEIFKCNCIVAIQSECVLQLIVCKDKIAEYNKHSGKMTIYQGWESPGYRKKLVSIFISRHTMLKQCPANEIQDKIKDDKYMFVEK